MGWMVTRWESGRHLMFLYFCRTLQNLKTLGVSLIPILLPSTPYALSAYYVLASARASRCNMMAFVTVNLNCTSCFNWSQACTRIRDLMLTIQQQNIYWRQETYILLIWLVQRRPRKSTSCYLLLAWSSIHSWMRRSAICKINHS